MSSLGTPHPSDEQLLRYADGELQGPEAESVRAHLASCWECRAELEETERTIAECVRYRKSVLETCLPPPPAPWFDIYRHFAGMDALRTCRSFSGRALDALWAMARSPRQWATVAIALLLIVVLVEQFRHVPPVRASELLHKAIAAAESRPRGPRRIQIRTRAQRVTRVIGSGAPAAAAAKTESLDSLESLFRAAHYSWDDPLSAKSYSEWRDQLQDKQDQVTTETDAYRVRTTTGSGEVAEATLTLRTADLHAVEGTIQFRNSEWVEITELPEAPAEPATVSETAPVAKHMAPPERPAEVPPAATPGEELQVLAALHRLGADLGDPVEVTRSGGQVLVSGVGVAPERQQEIRQELRALPHVQVRFSDVPAESAQGTRPSQSISVGPAAGRVQAELEKRLGGRAAYEQFSDQVLESTDAFMARAYALRRLAERFPADVEPRMTPEERRLLSGLRQEHAAALLRSVGAIEDYLQPVLGAPPAPVPVASASASWQDATVQLYGEARRAEALLVAMLGGAPGEAQPQELPARVQASLAQLRSRAAEYERLTTAR